MSGYIAESVKWWEHFYKNFIQKIWNLYQVTVKHPAKVLIPLSFNRKLPPHRISPIPRNSSSYCFRSRVLNEWSANLVFLTLMQLFIFSHNFNKWSNLSFFLDKIREIVACVKFRNDTTCFVANASNLLGELYLGFEETATTTNNVRFNTIIPAGQGLQCFV